MLPVGSESKNTVSFVPVIVVAQDVKIREVIRANIFHDFFI